MKKYININSLISNYFLVCVILFALSYTVQAQNYTFNQRTSTKAPAPYTGKSIYNLRGDFEMIGNTNLVAAIYMDNDTNNDKEMRFVDIDGDTSTVNSSAAYLNLPEGQCVNVVYAGLYWSGRAQTGSNTDQHLVDSNIYGSNTTTNVYNNASNISYSLGISRRDISISNRYPIYTLVLGGTKTLEIHLTNNTTNSIGNVTTGRAYYFENGLNTAINLPGTYDTSTGVFTPSSPFTHMVNGKTYTINSINRNISQSGTSGSYTDSRNYITLNAPSVLIKSLDKRKVKIKKANGTYVEVLAQNNEILYPNTNKDYVYVGYADVTDIVTSGGAGNYFVADIATKQGDGGRTGYSGGWGMVVIYEDDTKPWRDIVVFDGHAHVGASSTTKNAIEVSGFHAAQWGDVNVDIGFLAAEGESDREEDYFRMRSSSFTGTTTGTNWNATNFPYITIDTSTVIPRQDNNFFNSTITNGYGLFIDTPTSLIQSRTPYHENNYGFDLGKIRLDNKNQKFIKNNQRSTSFYYGNGTNNGDTYVIYNVVFAVDAYVPEAMPINMPVSIFKAADSSTITDPVEITQYMKVLQPNDILEMEMKIVNTGNERVRKAHIDVEIPKEFILQGAPTMSIGNSAVINPLPTTIPTSIDTVTTSNNVHVLDSNSNSNSVLFSQPTWLPNPVNPAIVGDYEGGLISWYLGTIPTQQGNSNPFNVAPLATMKYTLKVTANCEQLKYSNATCFLVPEVAGGIYGRGELSNSLMQPEFIIGLKDADCLEVEKGTLDFNIKADPDWLEENCPSGDVIKDVELVYPCSVPVTADTFTINKRDLLLKTSSELLADGDSSTTATSIVYRYPVGTRFFTKPPSNDTPTNFEILIDTATFAGTVDVHVDLDTTTNTLKGKLYAVIPIHHEENPDGPFNCYYVVNIIIPSKSELPEVPKTVVTSCSGQLYDYDVEIAEGTIGDLELRYYEQTNPEVTNVDSKTWRLLPGKPYPNAVGTHKFAATQGFVEGSTVICESDKAPYVIEIKGCSIPANPQLMNKYRKP